MAEVTASTASYDLHDKLASYRRNGVREYLVCRVLDRQIDWFVLREGTYERLDPAPDGSLRSTVFPGLWLDPAALLRGDLPTVLALVQQGLASPEHAEFDRSGSVNAAAIQRRTATDSPRGAGSGVTR